jgi:hypothetical protein
LENLSRHNVLEHDVSLVHDDYNFGSPPQQVNKTLLEQLASFAPDGYVGVKELAEFRKARLQESRATNRNLTFGPKEHLIALGEAAALLGTIGGYKARASLEDVLVFLGEERLPRNYKVTRLSIPRTVALVAQLAYRGA